MLLILSLCALGFAGLSIVASTYGMTPRKLRRPRKPALNRTRSNPLLREDLKRYDFPHEGMTPGVAFQHLVVSNSDVPLVLTGERDEREVKGWYEATYSMPLVDSWTRLQRHLDALQSYVGTELKPTLALRSEAIKLRVVYFTVPPSWGELTPYLRAGMGVEGDATLDYLCRFDRFRITGGSEAGKSPTAKRIALALGTKYGVRPILSNPQSHSSKNYWGGGFDVEACTHPQQYELILSVADEVISRGERPGAKPRRVYVFDELDSTVAYLDDKEVKALKKAVMMIIKQASHQGISALFLGQTSAANLLPGTTKSDWMSLVTVAIGSTGYDAIAKSPALTTKTRGALTERYEELLRKCETANKGCGDRASWHRAAVVFDPSTVELVVLPTFT